MSLPVWDHVLSRGYDATSCLVPCSLQGDLPLDWELPLGWEWAHPLAATAAVGKHPTGIHSCYQNVIKDTRVLYFPFLILTISCKLSNVSYRIWMGGVSLFAANLKLTKSDVQLVVQSN